MRDAIRAALRRHVVTVREVVPKWPNRWVPAEALVAARTAAEFAPDSQ